VPTAAATNVTVTGEVEPGANSNKCYNTWALCRGVSARVNPEEGTFSLPGVPLYPGTNVLVVVVRDVSGNEAEQTRTVVRTNALETFEYDGNGNLTNWVSGAHNWSYEWDWADRLVKVERWPGTPQGSWRGVERQYDVMSRRIRQTAWTWLVQSNLWVVTEDLKFLSDPLLLGRHLVDPNASNNVPLCSYVWGLDLSETMDRAGGVGGLLWVTLHTGSGAGAGPHFCAYDGNGNIVALSAASDGSATARYEYGPFGEPIRMTGPAAAQNPFRFSTKRTGSTTELVLYEYRAYSATMGKWANRDPINEPGFNLLIHSQNPFNWDEERNLYGFARNNLASAYDPLGLSCCICVFKGKIGKLTINSNCKGVLSIWVIDKGSAPAAGATAGSTVSADGYVLGGTTYEIDGSTCVDINCAVGKISISCCVNHLAAIMGKKCPYAVAAGIFGGPPKEPTPGSTPPVAK